MKLKFYEEICCDECNETIHNHFECPKCSVNYAGTNQYGSLSWMDEGDEVVCEECGAVFTLTEKPDNHSFSEWEFLYGSKSVI